MQVTDVELRTRPSAERDRLDQHGLQERSNLSRAQFLMWLGQQIDPEIPLYNMIQVFRIDGPIVPAAFDRAWQSVVGRSDALRMTVAIEAGVPMSTVHDALTVATEVIDLRDHTDPDSAVEAWIENRKGTALRLEERLWDTALLQLADDRWVWYLCQHHLITDGQSFALVYHRVSDAYELAIDDNLDAAITLPQ